MMARVNALRVARVYERCVVRAGRVLRVTCSTRVT
jgi:hypothetical protein